MVPRGGSPYPHDFNGLGKVGGFVFSTRFLGFLTDPPARSESNSDAASEGTWAVENCSLAAETLTLAAGAAGLGSCWIGFAQNRVGTKEGHAALNLPDGYVLVAPIIVGHPKAWTRMLRANRRRFAGSAPKFVPYAERGFARVSSRAILNDSARSPSRCIRASRNPVESRPARNPAPTPYRSGGNATAFMMVRRTSVSNSGSL